MECNVVEVKLHFAPDVTHEPHYDLLRQFLMYMESYRPPMRNPSYAAIQ